VKAFGIEVKRAQPVAAPVPTPEPRRAFARVSSSGVNSVRPGSLGGSGETTLTDMYGGGPDINPDLDGRAKFDYFQEMRMSDPAVRSVLYMWKLPIRQATWQLLPASEDGADKLIRDACAWQFGLEEWEDGRLDLSWDEWLQQSFGYLDWGSQFEEIIWGDITTWVDGEGGEHVVRPISRVAPRHPATVLEMPTDERTGLPKYLLQDLPGAQRIPPEKLVWYVLDKEGNNWFGTSLLRAMYGSWRLKKDLMIGAGIGYDRYAAGIPLVRYPKDDPDAEERAKQIGRNYRLHERGYVVLEGTEDDGWSFEIMDGSGSLADPVKLLQYHDQQISEGGLLMMKELGQSATGSRAVGEVQEQPYYMALNTVATHIRDQRRRRVFRRFVDVNFGPQYKVPKLMFADLQPKYLVALAESLAALSSAGLSFTDRDTQNDIRDRFDLRPLPELADTADGLPEDVGLEPNPLVPTEGDALPE
jgi:hypothetical protein